MAYPLRSLPQHNWQIERRRIGAADISHFHHRAPGCLAALRVTHADTHLVRSLARKTRRRLRAALIDHVVRTVPIPVEREGQLVAQLLRCRDGDRHGLTTSHRPAVLHGCDGQHLRVHLNSCLASCHAALGICLLYTSDAADERSSVDLGGRRIIKKKKNEEVRTSRVNKAKKHTK